MSKEHVIAVAVFLCVLLALGGVYQFYFKERVYAYTENVEFQKKLEERLDHLGKTFSNTKPEVIVSAWRNEIQPWADAVAQRAAFFVSEDYGVEPVPERQIPKFHYEEQYHKLFLQLQQDAYTRQPPCQIPPTTFGAPRPEDFRGNTMSRDEVVKWLTRINYGCAVTRMLIKANAYTIDAVELWPPRKEYGKLLRMQTVGYQFTMTLRDLVAFLDSLRSQNRYVTIDAISIQNPYLRTPWDPVLTVQLLLTQASFVTERGTEAGGAAAPGGGPSVAMSNPADIFNMFNFGPMGMGGGAAQRPSKWKRYWRTFLKYFWPF